MNILPQVPIHRHETFTLCFKMQLVYMQKQLLRAAAYMKEQLGICSSKLFISIILQAKMAKMELEAQEAKLKQAALQVHSSIYITINFKTSWFELKLICCVEILN